MGTDDDIDFDRLMRELPDGKVKGGKVIADPVKPVVAKSERAAARTDLHYEATAEERAAFLAALGDVKEPKEPPPAGGRPIGTPDVDKIVRLVRRGQVEPDATIDLHGRDRQRALADLKTFIAEAQSEKWRVVRVIVGKGLHSKGGDAVLGPAVERWLGGGPALEIMRAPSHLGGSGALIVVLRLE